MIRRSKRSERFAIIGMNVIEDNELDWRDLGMLSYLLSRPDNWCIHPTQLAKLRKAGRDAIYAMLKRLRDVGYVDMVKRADGSVDWVVHDEKQGGSDREDAENYYQIAPRPDPENPDPENPDLDEPDPENPDPENPDVLINTDSKLIINTPLTHAETPEGEIESPKNRRAFGTNPRATNSNPRQTGKNPRAISLRFDDWYALYPVKKSKAAARQSWIKQNLDERADELMAILRKQMAHDSQWQSSRFIPHPSTYLNQQRWEDEVTHEANRPVQPRSRHEQRAEISRYIDQRAAAAFAAELGGGAVCEDEGDLPAEVERPVL